METGWMFKRFLCTENMHVVGGDFVNGTFSDSIKSCVVYFP